MENVVNYIVWALTHVKRNTVPAGAVLPIKISAVGTEPWEYLYGTTGRKATQSLLDERYRNYYGKNGWTRSTYDAVTDGWTTRGVTVCDCQGLLDYYLGNDTNADGNYRNYCTDKGRTTDITRPYVIGEAVFNGSYAKKTHVGWVCGFTAAGDPIVIHERGIKYGCVLTTMTAFPWDYRGLMTKKFEYEEKNNMAKVCKLTDPMMRGEDIKVLQSALNALGYDCGTADGICGKQTMAGIQAFCAAHGAATELPASASVAIKIGDKSYSGTIDR